MKDLEKGWIKIKKNLKKSKVMPIQCRKSEDIIKAYENLLSQ